MADKASIYLYLFAQCIWFQISHGLCRYHGFGNTFCEAHTYRTKLIVPYDVLVMHYKCFYKQQLKGNYNSLFDLHGITHIYFSGQFENGDKMYDNVIYNTLSYMI